MKIAPMSNVNYSYLQNNDNKQNSMSVIPPLKPSSKGNNQLSFAGSGKVFKTFFRLIRNPLKFIRELEASKKANKAARMARAAKIRDSKPLGACPDFNASSSDVIKEELKKQVRVLDLKPKNRT